MAQLRLRLLGGFELHAASGDPVNLPPKKARALLAYLALTGTGRSRATGLHPAWEDATSQARTSLRQALTPIRKSLPMRCRLLAREPRPCASIFPPWKSMR